MKPYGEIDLHSNNSQCLATAYGGAENKDSAVDRIAWRGQMISPLEWAF